MLLFILSSNHGNGYTSVREAICKVPQDIHMHQKGGKQVSNIEILFLNTVYSVITQYT